MAIYKLGEISNIINGSKVISGNGNIPVVGSGGIFGYTKVPKTTQDSIAIPRKGTMNIHYYDIPVWNIDTTYLIEKVDSKNVLLKYLYYALDNSDWEKLISGSTRPAMTKSAWESLELKLPSKIIQQEIIDIIKPLETSLSLINNMQNSINELEQALLYNSTPTDISFDYHKGGLAGNEGETMFLNVAAANGNPNRYVDNKPNIFIGDITLSLDGNCGLVNNSLHGYYNGYLYKVSARKISNWQVYYSLKTEHSQNIIKLNETGTTIKHASGAKNELVVHRFENSKFLELLFNLRIKLHVMKGDLEIKLNNTIKLLIK